jgi:hypothetical protein
MSSRIYFAGGEPLSVADDAERVTQRLAERQGTSLVPVALPSGGAAYVNPGQVTYVVELTTEPMVGRAR